MAPSHIAFEAPGGHFIKAGETARDLLLLFFESTLHVSPDQQLSALQPLTK
jgi:hypothetical protein